MPEPLRQRAELTFRENRARGRHGWLRLTPAYSVRLVEELLAPERRPRRVLDPFSGTATTTLAAAGRGHEAISIDLNPFLAWLGNVKLAHYDRPVLEGTAAAGRAAARDARGSRGELPEPPPIHNVDRWWPGSRLETLCRLRAAIDRRAPRGGRVHDLLTLAFCRAAIESSTAAFNHQSMSFQAATDREPETGARDMRPCHRFERALEALLHTARPNPPGQGRVILGDARALEALELGGSFDRIITSPPYPNRMSYIRELRPYMYWTGFLREAREAGEMDWRAIGGTWGVATSRLTAWHPDPRVQLPDRIQQPVARLGASEGKNAALLARYVARYFEDMARHVSSVAPLLSDGGRLDYIVGNSKFYDVLVPTEEVLRDLFSMAGLRRVQVRVLRKRNSKKELYEYAVSARR